MIALSQRPPVYAYQPEDRQPVYAQPDGMLHTRSHSFPISESYAYHGPSTSASMFPTGYEPLVVTKSPNALRAAQTIAAATKLKPDKSKRFLGSRLFYSHVQNNGRDTTITFTSSNSTWGTVFNSMTLGLSAPLCRVYFVELMLEGRVLQEGDDVNRFLRESFGFINSNESTTGGELVRWLNYQQRVERKVVSFEKLQGNSFAVYCVTIPPSGCIMPDPTALRECAIRKYRYLDGVDNVLMLGGRFHNSVWALFK